MRSAITMPNHLITQSLCLYYFQSSLPCPGQNSSVLMGRPPRSMGNPAAAAAPPAADARMFRQPKKEYQPSMHGARACAFFLQGIYCALQGYIIVYFWPISITVVHQRVHYILVSQLSYLTSHTHARNKIIFFSSYMFVSSFSIFCECPLSNIL